MNIDIERHPAVNVLTPAVRRLDASVSAAFREGVAREINAEPKSVIIDFTRVDFIDSSCLGTLVSLLKMMNGKGELVVCALNPGIKNMFALTRMDRIFTISPDRASALSRFHL